MYRCIAWHLLAVLLAGTICLGCVKPADTEPPPQYRDLFDELVKVDREIQDLLTADPPGDAHDLVHEAGHVLAKMAELDSQSGLNATQCADVHNIAQDLLSAFGELDSAIEAGETPNYESKQERIQSGMAQLRDIADGVQ